MTETDLKALSLEDLARELDAVPYWEPAPKAVITELRRRDEAVKALVELARKALDHFDLCHPDSPNTDALRSALAAFPAG